MITIIQRTLRMSYFNLKIVFGNKFIYFLLAAFVFFLFISGIYIYNANRVSVDEVYGLMLFPGILLLFYPSVFGIQNDADARTLEIIFGIPDYRFKVWLFRWIISIILTYFLLIPMALIASYAIIPLEIIGTTAALMPSLMFVGALAFLLSTVIKNGNGTAVAMVVLGVAALILGDNYGSSQWYIFLNPYELPNNMNEIVWDEIIFKNRIFLISSTVGFLLFSMLNLQRREKFLG